VALVNGLRAPIAGVVTMDMTMLDVTDVTCQVGDVATFLGRQGEHELGIMDVAASGDLSPYELLVGLGLRHLLQARLVLHVVAGAIDLCLPGGIHAGFFLATAQLFGPTCVFGGAQAALFLFAARLGFCVHAGPLGRFASGAGRLFIRNALLLEVHQLVEGEQDGAFVLIGHGG
jgi:hypothetical protein